MGKKDGIKTVIKITKVDELMKPIFDDFLGLEQNGIVGNILIRLMHPTINNFITGNSNRFTNNL